MSRILLYLVYLVSYFIVYWVDIYNSYFMHFIGILYMHFLICFLVFHDHQTLLENDLS